MTPKDILEAYGIDFDTLKFQLKSPNPNNLTEYSEVRERLATDEIIVDGSFIDDFDIVADKPNGYIELYWSDDLANAAEARCAQMDW